MEIDLGKDLKTDGVYTDYFTFIDYARKPHEGTTTSSFTLELLSNLFITNIIA